MDGEKFSLKSNTTDLATFSIQLAVDCFQMGKAINQFRRLCRPQFPVSLSPSEGSNGTCSSISVTETARAEKPRFSSHAEQIVHENCDNDKNKDAFHV